MGKYHTGLPVECNTYILKRDMKKKLGVIPQRRDPQCVYISPIFPTIYHV